ncbi:formylglycine-generating enzyme family protein [Marinilongibacter aquaticus]|uniref:type IX secretion system lipoprotein PorK/GldK n=1 Tax=Marinilongibacter aquaticus TaxID=2975157 RepID=UPI0021BDC9DD|nr:formylglycine-generating enzyme family protein [Marinilongibacter aquaticus]UBM58405.1 formylglycine-generating enzyme family protein [Marinilongibacter aquaticus]
MNKRFIQTLAKALLLCTPLVFMQSCSFLNKTKERLGMGKSGGGANYDPLGGVTNGEIIAPARKGYKQTAPAGMVLIPSGSFLMGQADQDVFSSRVSMNKRVTINPFYMDDTEITNNEYRAFVNFMMADSVSVLGEEYIMTKIYPDTTVWKKDFTFHNGDQMTENYFSSPAFDEYPVVGVTWDAAQYFSDWRTNQYNAYRVENNQFKSPSFRLPSEAEWEWAARGGREGAKYPWGNPYVSNAKGCFMANFKPFRGNYRADGFAYTAPANAFDPNDFGLYNMAGNVAEWTQDAFSESYMPITWDMNPTFDDPNEPRKVVKGGSWKDVAYFLETGTTTFEYQNVAKSYIGFRNVMDRQGAVPGRE